MNAARLVARILVGLLFVFAGGSGFFITTPPPVPGLAGTINAAFYQSHWVWFLAFAQIVIGVLLLLNRWVPIALIMLAAFLYNSFGFHITMAQNALWAPTIVTALWLLIAWPYRALFVPILAAQPCIPEANQSAN